MNFPLIRGKIVAVAASWVVTEASRMNNIWDVSPRNQQLLTKRRAVDFCLVATAICCAVPGVVA